MRDAGCEMRQVVDIDISGIVTEYRAQVPIDDSSQRFVANFPEAVTRPVEYGNRIEAHSVYLSHYSCCPTSAFRIISRINWASR